MFFWSFRLYCVLHDKNYLRPLLMVMLHIGWFQQHNSVSLSVNHSVMYTFLCVAAAHVASISRYETRAISVFFLNSSCSQQNCLEIEDFF